MFPSELHTSLKFIFDSTFKCLKHNTHSGKLGQVSGYRGQQYICKAKKVYGIEYVAYWSNGVRRNNSSKQYTECILSKKKK